MAKKSVVSEVAAAVGAAAARVENLKPRRSTTTTKTKHSKAKGIVASQSVPVEPAFEPDRDQVAKLAYLYWEARGYQGGSPESDWIRAEEEVRTGKAGV